MIRRPPRSTQSRSSAASDVYKRQLDQDPFTIEGDDPTKLQPLKDAVDWSTNLGYPGPASPAVGEINGTFILPNMLARVARGGQEAEESVEQAHQECEQIFEKWRSEGLVGGS